MDGLLIMSRNIKDSQRKIFEKIQEKGEIKDSFIDKRFLCFNENELHRFPQLKIKEILSPTIMHRFMIVSDNNINYLIVSGCSDFLFTANIDEIELSVDLWIVAITELNLTINSNITPEFVKEYILPDIEDELKDQKQEVPFQKIVECFPEISIFTINDAVNDYKNEINKLCIDFFCTHDEFVFLKFNANCIKSYKNILNCGYNEIPLDNILRSLTTTHWRYCFLDLYRCIERLYIIARAKEYKRDFNSSLSIVDILPIIEKKIQKNPQEDLALKELFSLLPPSSFTIIYPCKEDVNQDNSSFYYSLRNSIVHHRKDIMDKDFDDDKWNLLITFSLNSIEILYAMFNADLSISS